MKNSNQHIAYSIYRLLTTILTHRKDRDVPIDNNASERAIRGFCIGKKNWEMIDTVNGANSSEII